MNVTAFTARLLPTTASDTRLGSTGTNARLAAGPLLPGRNPGAPLKVLLGAFACAPGRGSEEGVGWGIASSLAQEHRVHVLTTPRFRLAIERELADRPQPNLTFSYFDFAPALMRCVVNSALWQLYYHAWQCRIGTWARSAAETFEPDIVHHITYGRYWTPTTLWKLGRPFVWGPLGGGDQCPPTFLPCLSWRERLTARARSLAQRLAHLDPHLRDTARLCDIALASTAATEDRLRALGCTRVLPLLQMAVDEQLLDGPRDFVPSEIVFCTVGRLLGWKAQSIAVRAFAKAAIPSSRLVVIGEGPTKQRLVALAARLGIGKSVTFTGALGREQTFHWMRQSVALLHPSLHDQAPTVVFEAMALGTPAIALALGGIVLQVTPDCGIAVEAERPSQASRQMAVAMRQLAADPELRRRLAAAGMQRVRSQFTWTRKAEQFTSIYHELLYGTRKQLPQPSTSRPPVNNAAELVAAHAWRPPAPVKNERKNAIRPVSG